MSGWGPYTIQLGSRKELTFRQRYCKFSQVLDARVQPGGGRHVCRIDVRIDRVAQNPIGKVSIRTDCRIEVRTAAHDCARISPSSRFHPERLEHARTDELFERHPRNLLNDCP